MSVSVLILTLNEEGNIANCLESVRWSDDVVVLDSGSTDRTCQMAAAAGARVLQRPFDDYANQRNFGLRDVSYRYAWVLMLDADERVEPGLAAELVNAVKDASPDVCLFRMRRRDYLFATWIRASGGYPTWFPRLARLGRVWIERPINEEYRTDGRSAELHGHLAHFPFNNGFSAWIARHNRYSSMEAELIEQHGLGMRWVVAFGQLISGDPLRRRRALKRIVYRVPLRPLIVFLAAYVFRLGFLEGRAGLTFATLRAWYEFMIDLKRREIRRRASGLGI